ncbi:hypothetical protein QFZ76_007763 [Streptomyces sp. V4I2]|nr:hypothetical protein [Streptomyces sp. V4I2]
MRIDIGPQLGQLLCVLGSELLEFDDLLAQADLGVRRLPAGRTSHAGLSGPFILLETPDYQRLAYTETQRGSQLIADPDEVAILNQKYAMLRAQALTPEDTRELLDRLLGER